MQNIFVSFGASEHFSVFESGLFAVANTLSLSGFFFNNLLVGFVWGEVMNRTAKILTEDIKTWRNK